MAHLKVIKQKEGLIIKNSEDPFDAIEISCKEGHHFSLHANDIIMDSWCPHCQGQTDIIESILKELGLTFKRNLQIQDETYQYALNGSRKFILNRAPFSDHRFKLAQKNGYHLIIIHDDGLKDLKDQIWSALKENKEVVMIGKKEAFSENHQCSVEEFLGQEKDETGSVIKSAPTPWPEMVSKAVGYIRVSTVMQVQDGFSLEAQESKISHEAAKHNLFLRNFYIDKGLSGGSMDKRLALEKMRNDLKEGEWIIVNSVSRLARNTKDLLSMVEEIEKKNCHLIIIDLNLDITSPSGKLILTLMASQAQFERELTSERVKGVLQHLKKTGNLRSKPNFGWKLNPDRSPDAAIHIRNEEEQKIITNIRLLRRSYPNLGVTAFTRKLNNVGVQPPRNSKVWYHKTVKVIMDREGIK